MTSDSAHEPTSIPAPGPVGRPEPDSARTASTIHAAASPHLPADQGLSGLGILLELGGSVFAFVWLFAATAGALAAVATGGIRWLVALFLVLGIVRAGLQASAGRAIVAGHRAGALTPLRSYVRFGFIHAAGAVLLLSPALGIGTAVLTGAALAIWPSAMIFLVLRTPIARTPGARGIDEDAAGEQSGADVGDIADIEYMSLGEKRYKLSLPADNGYECLALLMLVFGLVGAAGLLVVAIVTGAELVDVLAGPAISADSVPSVWLVALLLVLAFRSYAHVRAAVTGLRGATTAEFEKRAVHYSNVGVITAYVGAACIVLMALMSAQPIAMGSIIAATLLVFWCLLVWPRIVARFVRERSLAEILASGHHSHRAPDKGLTALGWLLCALGLSNLAMPVLGTSVLGHMMPVTALAGFELDGVPWLVLLGLSVLCGASMVLAGVALLRMTPRFRLAVRIFIAFGLISALVGNWNSVRVLGSGSLALGDMQEVLLHAAKLSLAFLLPITTWVLLRRTDRLPSAQATFRQ